MHYVTQIAYISENEFILLLIICMLMGVFAGAYGMYRHLMDGPSVQTPEVEALRKAISE